VHASILPMPPQKSKINGSDAHKHADAKVPSSEQAQDSTKKQQSKDLATKSNDDGTSSKKRKADTKTRPNKAPRRSARSGANATPDPVNVLKYLLSPSSLDFCRPKDEIEDLKTRCQNTRTYSTSYFTPFEELICATILSRPIGHMLGLRSIRTIFNPPYDFITPKKIREAGNEGCRKALDKARTQHRQKTAEELVLLADAVVECLGTDEDDVSLDRVREESDHDTTRERAMLKKHVKGLGKTGLDIFGRRIQAVWPELYPFIDEKTSTAVQRLGLPGSADSLKELMENHRKELEMEDIVAQDAEEKKRKAFVRILERAVGADLEHNIESIKGEVAKNYS